MDHPLTPRLQSVPDTPKRALGMIRVSKERDGMVSPEIQRSAITDYCTRRGYVIIEWREGIDESGSRAKSAWWPRLNEAVGMVESQAVDVIVVWKYSRTARHRLRWAVALDKVETAGGSLESATEDFDTTTSTGRFTRGMLAEMAAFEAERIGDTWREAHARRVRMGLPSNGKDRFGYRVTDGQYVQKADEAMALYACYQRYVEGESLYSLTLWLNREGFLTAPGYRQTGPGRWSTITLKRVMDGGFAAGWFHARGQLVRGAHVPIIDEALWNAYRAARRARTPAQNASTRSPYLLTGLMRCTCGGGMTAGYFGRNRVARFRCGRIARADKRPGCGSVLMSIAEGAVKDWLKVLAADVEEETEAAARAAALVSRRQIDAEAIRREIVALDKQLARATAQLTREVIPETAYVALRDQVQAERGRLEDLHARAVLPVDGVGPARRAADLLLHWDGLSVERRRTILRQLVGRIEVRGGRPLSTVTVVAAWDCGESGTE